MSLTFNKIMQAALLVLCWATVSEAIGVTPGVNSAPAVAAANNLAKDAPYYWVIGAYFSTESAASSMEKIHVQYPLARLVVDRANPFHAMALILPSKSIRALIDSMGQLPKRHGYRAWPIHQVSSGVWERQPGIIAPPNSGRHLASKNHRKQFIAQSDPEGFDPAGAVAPTAEHPVIIDGAIPYRVEVEAIDASSKPESFKSGIRSARAGTSALKRASYSGSSEGGASVSGRSDNRFSPAHWLLYDKGGLKKVAFTSGSNPAEIFQAMGRGDVNGCYSVEYANAAEAQWAGDLPSYFFNRSSFEKDKSDCNGGVSKKVIVLNGLDKLSPAILPGFLKAKGVSL